MENNSDVELVDEAVAGKVKTYMKWSSREMDSLVDILLELVAEGQKSDNGFRYGHLTTCVNRLKTRIPGCKLTEKNVRHRIQQWKKVYVNVKAMEGFSGMGFDYVNKTLAKVDNDVWQTYVKVHKNVKGYKYKEFPYYPDWKVIYGSDQANGEISRNFDKAFEEMDEAAKAKGKASCPEPPVGDYYPDLEGIINADTPSEAIKSLEKEFQAESGPSSPPKKKQKAWAIKPKKAKIDTQGSGQIAQILERFVVSSEGRLAEITKQLAAENTGSVPAPATQQVPLNEPLKEAEQIMDIIDSMEDLSSIQQIMSGTRISMNPFYAKMFLRLKPAGRFEFITAILQNKLP